MKKIVFNVPIERSFRAHELHFEERSQLMGCDRKLKLDRFTLRVWSEPQNTKRVTVVTLKEGL